MNYRAEIDGLRAIAVLPVILFHAGLPGLPGGFLGVDIFFVISGFLITAILTEDIAKGNFSYLEFYERRARRLFPALFLVMFACIPFAWLWMLPSEFKDFAQSLVAVTFFASNILFWLETGYFSASAELKPLLHTWSLGVEEQFYIIFPVVLLVGYKYLHRVIPIFLVLTVIASFVICLYLGRVSPNANFYLMPSRMWELMVGAVAALYVTRLRTVPLPIRQGLALLGAALIAASYLFLGKSFGLPGFWTVLPVSGTVLVLLFATGDTLVGKWLSFRVFVLTGLTSYSAYLWHQPIFAFVRLRLFEEPGLILSAGLAGLSLVLAWLTWKFVENPIRYGQFTIQRRNVPLLALSLPFVGLIVALGLAGHAFDGFPNRYNIVAKATYANLDLDVVLRPVTGLHPICAQGFSTSSLCRTAEHSEVLLWGDSFAMHLAPGLMELNNAPGLVQQTLNACAPILGLAQIERSEGLSGAARCNAFNREVADWLAQQEDIRIVILSSPWGILNKPILFKDGRELPTGAHETLVTEYVQNTIRTISEQGKQVLVVGPPPVITRDTGKCLVRATLTGADKANCDFTKQDLTEESTAALSYMGRLQAFVPVVRLDTKICSADRCRASLAGQNLYRDRAHLSIEGSGLILQQTELGAILEKMLAPTQ